MQLGDGKEKLPPGFRFHPTDEELITYYLLHKISESNFTAKAIAEVDLNKCEPWDLPGKAKMGEKEWYFFSLRDRTYPTGVRTNRATNAGYWKTTGKDKEIYDSRSSELVGMKKTLVFYKGRAPRGEKTDWVMHEYRLQPKSSIKGNKDEWVVSRVFMKSSTSGRKCSSTGQTNRMNTYGLGIAGVTIMPSLLSIDQYHHTLGYSQAAAVSAEIAELERCARGAPGHNFQAIQPKLSFPVSFSQIPASRSLNLGGQHLPSPQPQLMTGHQLMALPMSAAETLLPPLVGCVPDGEGGYSCSTDGAVRLQNPETYVNLDGYWPTF